MANEDRLKIDAGRLWSGIEALAELTEPDAPWTRRSFTPMFSAGREWLQIAFRQAGLSVKTDFAGNLIGRAGGKGRNAAPIVLGSHSDTVPSGGRFDGILGVIAALEVAHVLKDAGRSLNHPLEVIDFLAEEPSEFGVSCVGSRAIAGELDAEMLAATRPDGMTLAGAIKSVGGAPQRIAEVQRAEGSVAAYLEVHIEQARALESAGLPLGVVTGIAAIIRERIKIRGQTDHAGATPMDLRKDALVSAASLIAAVSEKAASASKEGAPLVATVGRIETHPNAANAVPGRVEMILEARSEDEAKLTGFLDEDLAPVFDEMRRAGLTVTRERYSYSASAHCDERIISEIRKAAALQGFDAPLMTSGAGHDGVFMSRAGPFGMIFTSCKAGLSHTPEEWADKSVCASAAQALLDAVLSLDETL